MLSSILLVQVFRNLHAKGMPVGYSLISVETGRVVAILPRVVLRNAEFRVSEAGRQRVLSAKKKNVHAKVWGYFDPEATPPAGDWREVTYNPYRYKTFVLREDLTTPVTRASWAVLDQTGVRVLSPQSTALERKYLKLLANPVEYLVNPMHLVGGNVYVVDARFEYITDVLAEVVRDSVQEFATPLGGTVTVYDPEDNDGDTHVRVEFPLKSRAKEFMAKAVAQYPRLRLELSQRQA